MAHANLSALCRPNLRIAVIGGGVVGLAVAAQLAQRGAQVLVFERNSTLGSETSARNSGVVHAGLYYPTGSAKARLCVQGRDHLAHLIASGKVAGRMVGKLIVAVDDAQLPALQALSAQAQANGTQPLMLLDSAELHARAPQVRGVAALWSAGTGIVDPHSLVQWYRRVAEHGGAELLLRHRVVAVLRAAHGWQLSVEQPDSSMTVLDCDAVVNAAGLLADRVARLACSHPALPVHHFVKGNYFELQGPAPADCLVYPLPMPHLLGLGTHLTLDLAGQARLGPDTALAESDHDYRVDPGLGAQFLAAASSFLCGLQADQLRPAFAGIRPKLATDHAADFYIAEESASGASGWVNLLGIESPGLTASWAIGEEVATILSIN
jgi:L-2-hydroxyglutarate oxidase LhgO